MRLGEGRKAGIWAALALLLALAFAGPGAAGTFEGVASCAGSTCHGRAEGNGAHVRQDEILHWQDPSSPAGAHSRAYAVLAGKRGRQIAETLGLGSATSAPQCLGCHATVGAALTSDGVGCESCHGAASGWLASHYALAGSHAANVRNGMTDLVDARRRASVCLDCHFGSAEPGQFVTHKMMAAGHPRVAFELDLFSALQQHWTEDGRYTARKPRSDSVRLWAVGQAEAVARQTALFTRPQLNSQGLFPEFYFFDCHSCHRQITDGPARKLTFETNPGRPIPFATPPFNDENAILLDAVAKTLAPESAAAFASASRNFHAAMGAGRGEAVAAAGKLNAAANTLAGRLDHGYSADTAFTVVARIAERTTAARFTDYEGSVQAVMAVDTLLNALVREGRVTVGAAAGIRGNIDRAYAAVKNPNTYDPDGFRAALSEAARAIGSLR